jgi:hypothetical protein
MLAARHSTRAPASSSRSRPRAPPPKWPPWPSPRPP